MKAETAHVSGGCLCGSIRYESRCFHQERLYLPLHNMPEEHRAARRDYRSDQVRNSKIYKGRAEIFCVVTKRKTWILR